MKEQSNTNQIEINKIKTEDIVKKSINPICNYPLGDSEGWESLACCILWGWT